MKVLIADKLSPKAVSDLQELGCDVTMNPDLSADELPGVISDAEILIVRSTKVTAATIDAATNLSLIIRAGAGVNTIDLEKANKEIQAQRDLATGQRDQIAAQKKEITDSIHYAERIQRSILPSSAKVKSRVADYFVLFKPRDIVSGDFFWSTEVGPNTILVAADCTGHGVPGAFMSMLGISFLNEIVNKNHILNADEILNQLRNHVIEALKQKGKEGEAKDGMDIALCVINEETGTLQFAGANNPLYFIRDNELESIRGDKMPVAIHLKMPPFTLHEIKIKKGDIFYIFSDGFADQFGGDAGKKFKYKPFRELLLSSHQKPMEEQEQILEKTFTDWKRDYEQIDDVVIMGFRI